MNHELLKRIIFDQHETIRNAQIVPRNYTFEPNANYVLTGLRRAGKSTLLYGICRGLAAQGVAWNRLIYINFEDERLAEFKLSDFNDIIAVQAELSTEKGVFFFDEIQIIPGWEKFARRMADSKEHLYITGSNAKMLSSDVAGVLGGRFLTKYITPYSFPEYLDALSVPHSAEYFYGTKSVSAIRSAFDEYYTNGGFPESLLYISKRDYVSSVYQKVILGDIVARNGLRNDYAVGILIKKVAESVKSDISYGKLYNTLKSIGLSVSKDSVIEYLCYARDAYLIFTMQNYFFKFAERQGTPKYYFTDNGLLNLFLTDKNTSLLENAVASELTRRYPGEVYYMKSSQTGIDIDFYIEPEKTAIQVAYSISPDAAGREIGNLVKLSRTFDSMERFIIITKEEEKVIEQNEITIEVIPAYKYFCESA